MGAQIKIEDSVIRAPYPAGGIEALGTADSQDNLFFSRELESIIPQMFEVDYATISARSVFPIDRSYPPSTRTITYRQFDKTGASKIITDYANDIPLVQVFGQEFTAKVRTYAVAAQWSVDEIADAQMVGRPLDRMQTDAARETLLRDENRDAFAGNADYGIVGLFSDPNIPIGPVANPGGGTAWSTKTGPQMVADLCACADAIPAATGEVENATRILISPAQYRLAKCTQYNAGTDTSALDWFLANHGTVREVMPVRELTGAGPGGSDTMVAYTPDISKLRMCVVMEIEQRAPQENDLAIKVIFRHKFGGLIVHKPLSLNICHGI